MKNFNSLFSLLLIVLLFNSCNPSDDNSSSSQNDETFAQNFGNSVARDFIGQVVDVDNLPIQGVTISIGTNSVQTDVNGVFVINGANVHEKFAYITAKKSGYVDGSRAMVPTSGKNNLKIMLLPNTPLETIQSDVESEVSIYSGTKVKFDGAFQDENGNNYSGVVSVSMFHLTPSDENISKLMPGMLYGQRENNEQAVLETYGMLNVELRGSAGQKLNIKKGHKAEITLRIDDSQLATAPSTIPLWHFDEEYGYWKQDGVANKVGNKYVGEVSHFSWWNCDAPFQTVQLTVSITDSNGNPLPNTGIGLFANSSINTVIGYTDDNGTVSGLVPANQTMTLNVYQDCGVIYTTTIGPFSNSTVLPTITIPSSSAISTKIQGVLLKCNGSNVTNGYVLLPRSNGDQIIDVSNGTFSFNTLFCSGVTTFSLRAVDIENLQTTISSNYTLASPITNVGNMTICNSISDYVYYKLDNQPVKYIFSNLYGGFNSTSLPFSAGGFDYSTGNRIHVIGYTLVPGIYNSSTFELYDTVSGVYTYANENITYNLMKFGNVGELLEMTLSGTFDDNYGVNHTITATIHLKRTQ